MLKLLLIEDSEADAAMLQEYLSLRYPKEFSFVRASDLAAGLEALARSTFDALLLDLSLPDSDGVGAIDRIAYEHPQVPVVVVTHFKDEHTALEAVRRGAQDYLVKGEISPTALVRTIRHAIGRNESLQRMRRLSQIAPLLMAQRSVHTLVHFVASAACELIGARFAFVAMNIMDGAAPIKASASVDGAVLAVDVLHELSRKAGQAFLQSLPPLRMKAADASAWSGKEGVPNLLALPVGLPPRRQGVLLVADKKHGEFLLEDQIVLSQMGDMLQMAMTGLVASREASRRAVEAEQARSRLDTAQRELQQINEQLETRVRERTQDLGEALSKLQREMDEHGGAERRLRKSEARYRELAESVTDVFFAMDSDLRYTYWNKAAQELTGISPQEAVGRKFWEIFPQASGTIAEQAYQMVLKTRRPCTFLTESHGGPGDLFFEVNVYPRGEGITVFARDITLRRQAETALKESQEEYRDLVENHDDVLFTLDEQGDIRFISRVVMKLTGHVAAELIGQPFLRLVHPDDLLAANDALGVLKHGQDRTFECLLQPKQGPVRLVKVVTKIVRQNGKVSGTHGVMSDITASKQADVHRLQTRKMEQIGRLEMDGLRISRENIQLPPG